MTATRGSRAPWADATLGPAVDHPRLGGIAAERPQRLRWHRRIPWLHLAVFGGFAVLGVVLWWNVWVTGHPTSTIICQCHDPSQELWFLTWTPWALVHGHSPFLSNAIYTGQRGANMMVNTSWMLPAVLLAPITWLFGPVAAFNLAATIAPAISGWCFFLAARKVTTFVPAQVLGGLLWGFSPFVLENDPFGHLNFTLLFFPPLVFLVLHDLFVTHHRSPARAGVWLAVLVVAEFFTSTEMLALTALGFGASLIAAAVMAPRAAWAQRDRFLTGFGIAAVLTGIVLAYPVWLILAGPRHITGMAWPETPRWGTTASAIVDAGVRVHQSSAYNRGVGDFGGAGPNAGPFELPSLIYFGYPLLGFLAISAVVWFRSRLAWALVIGSVFAWLLSFGTSFANPLTAVGAPWLPWRLFTHVPLVSDVMPVRFAVMITFGVALLLAISLDRWASLVTLAREHLESRGNPADQARRRPLPHRAMTTAIVTIIGVAVLVPVALTNSLFTVEPSAVPAWFTTDSPHLPAGTVVLVLPFRGQRAMGWQAESGMHFALAGGFAVVPSADGRSAFVDPPGGAIASLNRLSSDPLSWQFTPLPATASQVAAVRAAIVRWQVGVAVVTSEGRDVAYSIAFMSAVYGRPPSFRGGTWVWTGAPSQQPITLGPTTLRRCGKSTPSAATGLTIARCTLA